MPTTDREDTHTTVEAQNHALALLVDGVYNDKKIEKVERIELVDGASGKKGWRFHFRE